MLLQEVRPGVTERIQTDKRFDEVSLVMKSNEIISLAFDRKETAFFKLHSQKICDSKTARVLIFWCDLILQAVQELMDGDIICFQA